MTTPGDVLAGLNDDQRHAAEAVRGPVCILAGAGSGKTTTIVRRIAHQVASGAFGAGEILAVTFTDKAAGEMRGRLAALGIEGVRARTFHSAALAQVRALSDEPPGQILPSKGVALRQIANTLPKPYRFRPAADLAAEIEWAKNRRITPERYEAALAGHEPPIPADLMVNVYRRYERGKSDRGLVDFEDLLERAIVMFQTDDDARERFAARYRAFTVDEYQDVNLLQETLLRAWLGERDDLCVVGDDYQSIYGFTGASPEYLLDMPARIARTKVVRLEANYRSTPQVLELANRLVPSLGGARKVLRATRGDGPEPVLRMFSSDADEAAWLVERVRALHDDGVAYEDVAVLYRVNFRSEDYEQAFADAGIPFQVRDGAFLTRQTARRMLTALARSDATDVAALVRRLAERAGWVEEPPDGLGEQELTRQNDLGRFVRLAEEFDDGTRTGADFARDVEARFGTGEDARGVNLLTLHRAKGLEFEAVFLPRVEEGELPFRRAKSPDAIAEERRLLYVGITRAKTHVALSWVADGRRKGSRFVGELRPAGDGAAARRDPVAAPVAGGPVLDALKAWRRARAGDDGVPAYVVFHDATLAAIAARRPRDLADLASVSGVGPAKLQRYGDEVLGVVTRAADGDER
ncbi:MAG TPA: ATP-dependent DNA helicase UvrD2 [Actinomycetota bacterium]|nr:ATP-dependent DNA helicase UvrD2 [Actinomycetota bacterium]